MFLAELWQHSAFGLAVLVLASLRIGWVVSEDDHAGSE